MCIDPCHAPAAASGRVRRRAWLVGAAWAATAGVLTAATRSTQAQTPGLPVLTAPLGNPVGAPGADGQLPPGALPSVGQGPGQHSPNSPFAPLPSRSDVVPWSTLTAVKMKSFGRRPQPEFAPEIRALHGTVVRVQGFMMPLAPGEKQTHFLVSSVPLTCAFCTPGGPESMLEVRTRAAVKYTQEAVVVEGRLQVLSDDPQGLFYRMTAATAVK